MKKHKQKLLLVGVGLVIAALIAGAVLIANTPGTYVMLRGTVTAYDSSPEAYDGATIFKIDGRSVDIGGGMRAPGPPMGEMDEGIKVGDKVEARLIINDARALTLYNCADCYVRLAE